MISFLSPFIDYYFIFIYFIIIYCLFSLYAILLPCYYELAYAMLFSLRFRL